MRLALAAVAVLVLSSLASAQTIVNPRITINNSIDCSSAGEVVKQIVKPDMTDEQKAIACWRFMLDHFYHWFPPVEDNSAEPVRDFAKAINSYGYSPCFGNAPVLTDLWEACGFKTRSWTITGHSIPEVFYGNAWHMLDADARAWHRKADGQIASVEELAHDAKLFTEPKEKSDPYYPFGAPDVAIAPLVPWGKPDKMMNLYLSTGDNYRYNKRAVAGHAMYLALRQGETLTLSPENVGKWFVFSGLPKDMVWKNARLADEQPVETKLDKGPVDVSGKITYGSGTLNWAPDFKKIKQEDLLWLGSENVQLKDGKLSAVDAAKPAVAVFRVYCPWVLVEGKCYVDKSFDKAEISTDGGVSWVAPTEKTPCGDKCGGTQCFSFPTIVPFPASTKAPAEGGNASGAKGATAPVAFVEFENTFQVAPLSLPKLVPGRNTIKVYRGPDEGVVQLVLAGNKAAKERYIVETAALNTPNSLAAKVPTQPGYAVYKLTAPANLTAISIGGNISISRGPIPFVQGEYSFDSGKTWTQAFKLDKNENPNNTQFEEDVRVAVPQGVATKEAWFKYTIAGDKEHKPGKQAGTLEAIRLYGYYRLPQPEGVKLAVELNWEEKVADQWHPKKYGVVVEKFPTDLMPDLGGEQVRLKSIVFKQAE